MYDKKKLALALVVIFMLNIIIIMLVQGITGTQARGTGIGTDAFLKKSLAKNFVIGCSANGIYSINK